MSVLDIMPNLSKDDAGSSLESGNALLAFTNLTSYLVRNIYLVAKRPDMQSQRKRA